ncbi:hypothetical protein Pse7367_1678 [Thalassoporum mexicanum PCC 7367]|uniref:DUF760 domain-containing protein n=1 Tax=Thalassoporum mexicanum TaxID=3457544 RepID=UPI00029FDED3|nr:DUF760 domain-containing protein [Pseudanabaena sp. PCC 7367]AFY69966.1 hypothetical protein Pse7367_1678 [Pseudanabaena sp. PCC 7367]
MFEVRNMDANNNRLLAYMQEQSPEALAEVAQSISPEVRQIISQNIQSLVGVLPPQHFDISITTDRENLSSLLGSAMMTGYFLKGMETRMVLEQSFAVSSQPVTETKDDINETQLGLEVDAEQSEKPE